MENKKKIFLGISIFMFLVAIGFIWFALNHPEMSFPRNNAITYGVCWVYTVTMVACVLLSKNKTQM